jgi:hypothetical protein
MVYGIISWKRSCGAVAGEFFESLATSKEVSLFRSSLDAQGHDEQLQV